MDSEKFFGGALKKITSAVAAAINNEHSNYASMLEMTKSMWPINAFPVPIGPGNSYIIAPVGAFITRIESYPDFYRVQFSNGTSAERKLQIPNVGEKTIDIKNFIPADNFILARPDADIYAKPLVAGSNVIGICPMKFILTPNVSHFFHLYPLRDSGVESYFLSNVQYDLNALNKTPVELINVDAIKIGNPTSTSQTASKTFTYSSAKTSSWAHNTGVKVGGKVGGEASIPFIAAGKVEVSGEASYAHTWGDMQQDTELHTATVNLTVPPGKTFRVTAKISKAKFDIPYKGVLKFQLEDGKSFDAPITGTYHGVSFGELECNYNEE